MLRASLVASALLAPSAQAATAGFDLSKLEYKNTSVAMEYFYEGAKISPWHDVPFTLNDDNTGVALLSFVCEIPRGTSGKYEIHKTEPYNPILQDVNKDGSLRYYMYSPAIVNYGAIAQTWEDPKKPDDDTGLGGDNDPIDVLQLNEGSCERGAVQRVRVLGGLALVDDDETDWKLLVIDVDAADAPNWHDVADIPKERVDEVREWYRVYKTAEGKGYNKYGLDGRAVSAKHALATAKVTHEHWAAAKKGESPCDFKKKKCWFGAGKDEL